MLESLERDTYRTVSDHGFFDLLLGAALVAFTLAIIVSPWIALIAMPLVIAKQPLLRLFNHCVVEPRVGHVRLNPVRLNQISAARKTAALVFFGLALLVVRLEDTIARFTWMDDLAPIQMAIIVGTGTAVAGWLFQLRRFLVYALVVLLAPVAVVLASLPAGIGWLIATVIVGATGCIVLYRFIERNPLDQ